jgi:hypothetical protein
LGPHLVELVDAGECHDHPRRQGRRRLLGRSNRHGIAGAASDKARAAAAEIVERQAGECAEAGAVRAALRLKCGEQVYETWLRPTLLSLDAGTMTIATASRFHLDYVERTLGETVEAVAIDAIGARGLRWEMLKPPDKRAA